MLRIVLCLFLVTITTCLQYSPLCQDWCCGQQPIVYPQMCNSYCGGGGYSGDCNPCSSGYPNPYPYPYPYPGNPTYPGIPIGPSFPGIPVGPTFPGTSIGWPGWGTGNPNPGWSPGNPNPSLPEGSDPIKVIVNTAPRWICPPDPQPRAGEITALPAKLIACEEDENCTGVPPQKCCYDQGVTDKVCKPAVLA